jgi:hypothetical protein
VLHFSARATSLQEGDTKACLSGIYGGSEFSNLCGDVVVKGP